MTIAASEYRREMRKAALKWKSLRRRWPRLALEFLMLAKEWRNMANQSNRPKT